MVEALLSLVSLHFFVGLLKDLSLAGMGIMHTKRGRAQTVEEIAKPTTKVIVRGSMRSPILVKKGAEVKENGSRVGERRCSGARFPAMWAVSRRRGEN